MGTRIGDITGIDPKDFGMTDAAFFEGDELEARLDAGLRACFGIAAATPEEAAIRKDIYDRNTPSHRARS